MSTKKEPAIDNVRIDSIYNFLNKIGLNIDKYKKLKSNTLDISLINEALTHTSINYPINHEKLEFLGDAVLRLAASEYIEENYPQLKVGDRSALRAQLVSDKWLGNIGGKIGIKKIMLIGTKALNDETAIETIEAEGLEALIGAIYKSLQDLKIIQNWLSVYWDLSSEEVLSDPHRLNSKSALQEWSQGKGLKKPNYETTELSKQHGDKKRFFCKVIIGKNLLGEGWGSSIKNAEKEAAKMALAKIKISKQFADL